MKPRSFPFRSRSLRPPGRGPVAAAVVLLGLLADRAPAAEPPAAGTAQTPLQIGFSSRTFGSVNENDGRAALRAHAEAIAKTDGTPIRTDLPMLETPAAMNRALERGEVDMLSLLTDEFLALTPGLVHGPLVVPVINGRVDDEYVLVVRADGGIGRVAGLQGRRVHVQRSARTPLAAVWLDILTMREQLGPAEQVCGQLAYAEKPSRVVLPVFFGQTDAAVVSQRGWQLMGELNPQLLRQLRVLATSRPMVASVMCFRVGSPQDRIDRVLGSVGALHTTISGRQLLTIFQTDRLEVLPLNCVDTTRELLAEHAQLRAAATATPARAAGSPP